MSNQQYVIFYSFTPVTLALSLDFRLPFSVSIKNLKPKNKNLKRSVSTTLFYSKMSPVVVYFLPRSLTAPTESTYLGSVQETTW
jgi:hypothetical protein